MLQVASFALPKQQDEANEFLKTHKPQGNINFNKDTIIVFYDDGEFSPEYEIADLEEYIQSMKTARFQQEVALHVMKTDLKKFKAGTNQWQDINSGILNAERGIANQDLKIAFVEGRIKQLRKNG
jgi:N-acetylneuraminic acid mutarotase